MVNLTTLAPDIVAAILDDALPNHVTLFDLAVDPPALWDEQRSQVRSVPGHPSPAPRRPNDAGATTVVDGAIANDRSTRMWGGVLTVSNPTSI